MVIVYPNQQCRAMTQCVSAQLDATNCTGFFMDAGVNYWAQANCTTEVVSFFSDDKCTNLDTTIDSKNNNRCAMLGSTGHSAIVAFDTNGCSSAGRLQSWLAFLSY
jgi:hypothetical protein